MAILTLDDHDPSIVYSGKWVPGGDPVREYDGTTTHADNGGGANFATVTFTGSSISVLGTVRRGEQPSSSYTVDTLEGQKITTFRYPTTARSYAYNFTFFQSDPLSPTGQHTLVIRPISGTLLLDSLEIVQDTLLPSSSSSPSLSSTLQSSPSDSSSSSSSTSSFPTQQSSSPSTSSSPPSTSTHQSSSSDPKSSVMAATVAPAQGKSEVPIGAIIGGALGALALICIFVLALLYLRRRRQERHFDEIKDAPPSPEYPSPHIQSLSLIDPYDISRPPQRNVKGQRLVGTGTGTEEITSSLSTAPSLSTTSSLVTAFSLSTGSLRHSRQSQQTPVVTPISPSVGSMCSSNSASPDALRNAAEPFPNSGGSVHDPPPVYHR